MQNGSRLMSSMSTSSLASCAVHAGHVHQRDLPPKPCFMQGHSRVQRPAAPTLVGSSFQADCSGPRAQPCNGHHHRLRHMRASAGGPALNTANRISSCHLGHYRHAHCYACLTSVQHQPCQQHAMLQRGLSTLVQHQAHDLAPQLLLQQSVRQPPACPHCLRASEAGLAAVQQGPSPAQVAAQVAAPCPQAAVTAAPWGGRQALALHWLVLLVQLQLMPPAEPLWQQQDGWVCVERCVATRACEGSHLAGWHQRAVTWWLVAREQAAQRRLHWLQHELRAQLVLPPLPLPLLLVVRCCACACGHLPPARSYAGAAASPDLLPAAGQSAVLSLAKHRPACPPAWWLCAPPAVVGLRQLLALLQHQYLGCVEPSGHLLLPAAMRMTCPG